MVRLVSLFLVLLAGMDAAAQSTGEAYPVQSKNKRHANIVVVSADGKKFKGRMIHVSQDYIVFDAAGYNSYLDPQAYYLRPEGNYYRMDLEYIYSIAITRTRSVGSATLMGATSGAVLFALVVASTISEPPFNTLGEIASGGAVCISLGTIAGLISGLVHKKNFLIRGDRLELARLANYFLN